MIDYILGWSNADDIIELSQYAEKEGADNFGIPS